MSGISSVSYPDYGWLFGTQNNKKTDSITQLWEGYKNYQSNAQSSISGLSEISNNLKSVWTSYNEAKYAFNTEFKENMSALKDSAKEVQKYSFSVAKQGAITKTETTDENGIVSIKTTYSKDLQQALDVVSEFVSNYNSSIKFFTDNASISKRVDNLRNSFSDTTYRAASYESIGLQVSSNGMLEINEEMLANAIVDNPDKVSSILGSDGLAGKALDHVSFAESQIESAFPTFREMFGNQFDVASFYTSKGYRDTINYVNLGNFVNMLY
ncbi:MAG: flagellar filament capping protein FliD [Selenomonadaceae bacterium]|nr:flagellar filament capping protein FliD [Selenomonadaceae bacterium]